MVRKENKSFGATASATARIESPATEAMRVRLAVDDAAGERTLELALRAYPEIEVKSPSGEISARSLDADRYDVLIVSPTVLKTVYETEPSILLRIIHHKRIILALSQDGLNSKFGVMPYVGGWFFLDGHPERIADIIRLSAAGYCLVPDAAVASFIAFRLRGADINRLTLIECAVLGELSLGHGDRLMSRRLGMTAGVARLHVQSVFAKLCVQTRTEARLFGLRHRAELHELRRVLIRRQSGSRSSQR